MNRYRLSKAGVDANEGIRRFSDNKALYEQFLNAFPQDEHYNAMVLAIEQGNVQAAFQAAHALKGIAGNLSLVQLHAEIIPLVEELRQGSLAHVSELLPLVTECYQRVVAALMD